jgi:threonine dehydrogenase-like Zn-dependent dehydrogenase
VKALGATYHSGKAADIGFEPEVIIECTGVGEVIGDSMLKLRAGGVMCLTGVGSGGITSRMSVADFSAAIVLKNLVLVGSVNANKRHWFKAGQALARADRDWLAHLITRREKPENFQQALARKPDDIKVVIQFSDISSGG